MQQEVIDFSKVGLPSSGEYLEPGTYRLKIDKEGTKVVATEGKTPYVLVKFVSETGGILNEKFFLTANALPRLQYLHSAWFGKALDKSFKSYLELGNYFVEALTYKPITHAVITGGKIATDGKFYSGLPYDKFVVPANVDFEEGPFEKDSVRYKAVVKIEKLNPLVANTNNAILPSGANLPGGEAPKENKGAGKMPWE